MFIPVILYLFAAAASCGVNGWETKNLYKYDLQMCYSFVKDGVYDGFFKSDLYIQPISSDKLSATIQNLRGIKTNDTKGPANCEAFPSDELLENRTFSDEPFEINLKKGVVTGLTSNPTPEHSEIVIIKTVASMFQLDLTGENCKDPKSCQLPTETNLNAVYETMEKSSGGVCETQYEVSPVSESSSQTKSDEKGQSFKVIKTTDNKKCSEVPTNVLFQNTNSAVVSGNMEQYIIQSADSKFNVEWPSKEKSFSPKITMAFNFNLTSTYPAEGPARSMSNPQEDSLVYKWLSKM